MLIFSTLALHWSLIYWVVAIIFAATITAFSCEFIASHFKIGNSIPKVMILVTITWALVISAFIITKIKLNEACGGADVPGLNDYNARNEVQK